MRQPSAGAEPNAKRVLSVVIPVFNGERTVETVCSSLVSHYEAAYDLEIVLVNDGSRDRSDAVCRALRARHPTIVTYIRLARNFGEHAAVMAGLNHVTGDVCVIMDDDLQTPPDQVQRLVDALEEGYDVVYASYPRRADGLLRRLAARLHDRAANVVLGKPDRLYLSSFKALSRFLVREIIRYTGPRPYIDGIILRVTESIGQVEVRHDARANGRSNYTLRRLAALWVNALLGYSLVPLRILALAGLTMTVLGLSAMGLVFVDDPFLRGFSSDQLETLQASFLFFKGLQLLATSLVGEYVGRLYLAFTNAPQFVVREWLPAARRPPVLVLQGAGGRGGAVRDDAVQG